MPNLMSKIPAIEASLKLASDAADEATNWKPYLEGVFSMAQELWDIPDASEQDRTRWIAYLYLDTAVEISMYIGSDQAEQMSQKAEALLEKYEIPREEDENVNLDVVTDISGLSNDTKVAVAAGIVAACEQYKDNDDILGAMKERFNNHASGIQPDDIPASLHKKMIMTIEMLDKLVP